jgi:Big-like domain-containing protein/parallel beta helix pectate lyase-like protein/pectate lyase-like protein
MTLYVSTQGSDSNPGTAASPFRTVMRAYSVAVAGTTIIVLPGVYTDYQTGWGLRLGRSGTTAMPIVLRSQVRGAAVIDGENMSDRNQGVYIDGSYNVMDGFEIRNGPKGGIAVWGNYNHILNCKIHHNGSVASSSTNGQDGVFTGENTRGTICNGNFVSDNGRSGSNLDHGLYLCGDDELIVNNVLVRNAAYGLHVAGYTTISNMQVYNNVIAHNGRSGIILWMALAGIQIKNNIIFRNARFGFDSWDAHGSGVVLDRNLLFGNASGNYNFTNGGSNYGYNLGSTIAGDPLFVNGSAAGFDAHLIAGSPAIGAGLNLSSIFTTDFDGSLRTPSTAWDLGVYSGTTVQPPIPPQPIAPTIAMTSPRDGAVYRAKTDIPLSANVTPNGNTIDQVKFYQDAKLIGYVWKAPYAMTWRDVARGSYTLTAKAFYDGGIYDGGKSVTSSPVSITVRKR